jgi:hypothetical protein
MSAELEADWEQDNQAHLMREIDRLRALLEREAGASADDMPAPWSHLRPPAVDSLTKIFGLSDFERDVILLCAGVELDSAFAALCSKLRGAGTRPGITFGFALAALDQPHWSALTFAGALRRWRLIELGTGDGLTQSALRIDERILHYLTGMDHPDARVACVGEIVAPNGSLLPSQRAVPQRIAELWTASERGPRPVVQLGGTDPALAVQVAATACGLAGWSALCFRVHDIPQVAAEREAMARLCEREAVLLPCAFILDCSQLQSGSADERAARSFLGEMQAPVVVVGSLPTEGLRRAALRMELQRGNSDERCASWQAALGPLSVQLNGTVRRLATQFELDSGAIRSVAALVPRDSDDAAAIEASLWDTCRQQLRPTLDSLADRIEPAASWADLVLPAPQLELLREMAVHVRRHWRVFEEWGFGSRAARGGGACAVFAGPSGTGKTMAAEVLASELRLDLYRIDLSSTVSKYIGETEKNLARIFDAGEKAGAILLFDEADALFGKRSEVRDAHDRYANIEVSYLLQRMEAYRGGIAILTTNMKQAIDPSFWRRLRFVIHFPFPDAELRAAIWRGVFPPGAPLDGLDFDKLARLNVAGGNIRNIAVNAAFRAADAGDVVRMQHLLWAARQEYSKLDRALSDAECRGWT